MYARGDCDNGLGTTAGWFVVVPLHMLDLPISVLTDTLCLPADIVRDNRKKRSATNSVPEKTARKWTDPEP